MDIKDFIIWWNNSFPFDKWWREKHQVPFNSPTHRNIDFISQRFEYEEDKMIKNLKDNKDKDKKDTYDYKQTGVWLKPEPSSFKDITQFTDEELDQIDWEDLDES